MARDGTRRSLRSVISGITFGLLAVTLICGYVGYRALEHAGQARAEHIQRTSAAAAKVNDLLTALVNQEVGLRGFLATGEVSFLEPYRAGEDSERRARSELWPAL